MSRSYKKHPAGGITTADSEKQDKRLANRAMRRINKARLKFNPEAIMLNMREVWNLWSMDKDGKKWHGWEYPRVWRK